ncbi:hypothetical protein QEM11_000810 [Pseudomonas putida]|nr:hypothetical protein [Pseudomonas putida]
MAAKKAGQEQAQEQVDQVNQVSDTPANGPAPTPGDSNGSDGGGNPTPGDSASAASHQGTTAGAAEESAASNNASASSDDASGSAVESLATDHDLRKWPYLVTGIIDVRHDGELYTKGQTLWLYQHSAQALLNKRFITPKEEK